jgi:hypothetical protein
MKIMLEQQTVGITVPTHTHVHTVSTQAEGIQWINAQLSLLDSTWIIYPHVYNPLTNTVKIMASRHQLQWEIIQYVLHP